MNEVCILARNMLFSFDISGNNDNFYLNEKEIDPLKVLFPIIDTDSNYPIIGADNFPIKCSRHALCKSNEKTTICPVCLACTAYGQKCIFFAEFY